MTSSGSLRFSVAMCTYNGASFVREQLESMAAQTLLPAELIVTDDGSRDATAQIIDDFTRAAPFPVRFVRNQVNLGSTKNFEHAIGLCQGDLIALSDQDDIWHPDKLSRFASIFEARPEVGGVFSDGRLIAPDSKPLGSTLWSSFGFNTQLQKQWRQGNTASILVRQDVVTGATLAFRSDLRHLIFPISANWIHDAWIAWILSLSSVLAFLEEPLIDYRVHTAQQEGVPGLTMKKALARTLRHRAADQVRTAAAFQDLRDHLQRIRLGVTLVESGFFDGKIGLCSARARLPKYRLSRLLRVLPLVPDYLRYSRGLREAAKDVLIG